MSGLPAGLVAPVSQRLVRRPDPGRRSGGHLLQLLRERTHKVGARDDAHEFAVTHHRHSLDVPAVHQMGHVARRRILGDRGDPWRHH